MGIRKGLEDNNDNRILTSNWETVGRLLLIGPPFCSSGPRVRMYRTPLKLVPLLASIGAELQLSPATPLCYREVCGTYLYGFRLCLRTARGGGG